MKLFAFVAGPRAGIDFLQSLFDGHPEVSQFPGCINFGELLKKIERKKTPENIASQFISDYGKFFDSRLNLIERHYMLGENKNSYYLINKNKFTQSFINFFDGKEINKKNIFYNLHYAYSLASGQDLKKKKIIILNTHQARHLKALEGLDYEIVHTIRDPIAGLCAGTKHWLNYEKGKHVSPWQLYFWIERMFCALKTLIKLKKKVHVVKLELLHRQNIKVMKEMAEKFNISFEQSLTRSTYHGKLWWGDKVSGKDLNGVNPNFKNNIDYNFFYKKDILCLEKYLRDFMIKYDYPISDHRLKFSAIKILPLKIEVGIWKKTLLNGNIFKVFSLFYFWIKRINLMKNNLYDNIDFPDPIGK